MHTLSEATVDAFHASLERCDSNSDFFSNFYRHFIASSPVVADKFSGTNFKTQTRVLKTSFYMAILACDKNTEAQLYLERIAERHNRRGLDIKPELYDLWLDSMIATVREHDPKYSDEIERVWRSFMQPAIDYMKSRY